MSIGYKRLTNDELVSFIRDIHADINVLDPNHFQRIIKYLIYILNLQLQETHPSLNLCQQIYDTITLLLHKKPYLINIHIPDDLIETIGVGSTQPSPYLCDVLIVNQLKQLVRLFERCMLDELISMVKVFISSVIHTSLSNTTDLFFRNHVKKTLQGLVAELVNHCYRNIGTVSLSAIYEAIQFVLIVNNFEIMESLMFNSFNFEILLKKCWVLVSSTKYSANDLLKSLLILNLTINLNISESLDSSKMSLVIEWILTCINEPISSSILVTAICQSLLKLLKLALKFDMLHNMRALLNTNYHLNNKSINHTIPLPIVQVLSIYEKYEKGFRFPKFTDPELNNVTEELSEMYKCDILDFLKYKSGYSINDLKSSTKLNQWLSTVLTMLNSTYKTAFDATDNTLSCTLLSSISNLPCLVSGSFDFNLEECQACGSYPVLKNHYSQIYYKRPNINDEPVMKEYYNKFILQVAESPAVSKDPLFCSTFLLCVYKLFASYRSPFPDLNLEPVFALLKSLMTSKNRIIRLLSGRILPLFLIDIDDINLDNRFSTIFQFLSSVQFDSVRTTHLAESTIKALAEVAIVSDGEWLNALVLRFVDLLGCSNEYHINLVCSAFHSIATAKGIKTYKLLSPFLPLVAVKLIKAPFVLDRILEVTAISKKYFLNLTKEYTIPHLLDYYKYDHIQDIADACNTTKKKLILKYLPKIIAVYLIKDTKIDDKLILNILRNAGLYKITTPSELYQSMGAGTIVWHILLKITYDSSCAITNRSKIENALEHVAKFNEDTATSSRNKDETKNKHIGKLLESHSLEIIQRVANCIHQPATPFFEKVLALKSIEFLIEYNINATASVLCQICTSIQSLIILKEFEYSSINCLNVLVKSLHVENLISLFDIVISMIFQKFDQLQTRSQSLAVGIIDELFRHINSLQNNYVLYYFSVPFIPRLMLDHSLKSRFLNFKALSKPKLKIGFFPEFTRRLKTLNKFVVKQALFDLNNYAMQFQDIIQQEIAKDFQANSASVESVSELIRTLLDTSYKFKNETASEDISTSCAKCLSIIGSLDSNKFHVKPIRPKITLIHNFGDYAENSVFLTDFLENIIITNFWASNNPIKQMHYSFAIQEFLKVMKLNQVKLSLNQKQSSPLDLSDNNSVYLKVWNKFSDVTKSTLIPFLSSKFYFSGKSKGISINYPLFKPNMSYESWVTSLTKDLIANSPVENNEGKKTLFGAFTALVTQNDLSISNYLLKYLVLTNIVTPDRDYFNKLILEFSEIFNFNPANLVSADSSENLKAIYQTIFEVLDYLNQWRSHAIQLANDENSGLASDLVERHLKLVEEFNHIISNYPLYEKSAYCGAYERTILYLERYYRLGEIDDDFIINNLDKNSSIHSMYANINDLDSLNGVLKNFSSRNTKTQLKSFQYNENWSLAQEAFHVLSENGGVHDEYKIKFLKSLNDHAAYEEVLSKLSSNIDMKDLTGFPLEWSLAGLEASMFSGDLEQLRKWFYITECIGTPQEVDSLIIFKLANILKQPLNDLNEHMEGLYQTIGMSLSSSSFVTSRNLNLMLQLHIIYDLKLLLVDDRDDSVNLRLGNVDQSFDTKWKVLSMHKFMNMLRLNLNNINHIHLECSKLARDNDKFHVAIASVMKAMNYSQGGGDFELDTNFEYSQLLWDQGKQTDAIKVLETLDVNAISNNKQKAKIQLQYADWLNESNHSSSKTIIDQYTKAYSLEKNWEKPYFSLGKYYDKLLESLNLATGYYEQQIIKCFLKALTLGPTYIFEALPKLITIWLDFAQVKHSREAEKSLGRIVKDIEEYVRSVPNYVWYTAVSQMLSRISHNHHPSVKVLQEIIFRTIHCYPMQTLWLAISHINSKDLARKDRVNEIMTRFEEASKNNQMIYRSGVALFRYFISVCETKFKKGTRKASITRDFKLMELFNRFSLVIPVKAHLDIKLPAHVHTKKEGSVFPKSSVVTFNGIDDQVNIFHSLQMPKQITIRGSDGRAYRLMLKNDDTRKDAKVVEFTTLINRLLVQNNEARKRSLTISNYAVTPLGQNMGVIEFVSDVVTMKAIIHEERRRLGHAANDRLFFSKLDKAQKICKGANNNDDGAAKAKLLKVFESIIERSPPVLHSWYINQFSDPSSWYLARTSYTRSSAVMSMVGYIIGLGDRHCENILFFKKAGSILHIDFDCLFEKGATLPTPEVVPFRLTQNMIDAMGINKVEGTFRRTCEVTESIMRENMLSLMNNLETLIYDPLLDWENQQNPRLHFKKVHRKLMGLLDEKEGLPMNIHGQVDHLIQIASSNEYLSQMYGGWAPYL